MSSTKSGKNELVLSLNLSRIVLMGTNRCIIYHAIIYGEEPPFVEEKNNKFTAGTGSEAKGT